MGEAIESSEMKEVLDYVKAFEYDNYQKMVDELPDDDSVVENMVNETKEAFKTRITFDMAFRKRQLNNLCEGLEECKDELCEAATKDLRRDFFTTYAAEVASLRHECMLTIQSLDGWGKDEVVDTPFLIGPGKSFIRPEPLGVVCILAPWNFPIMLLIKPLIAAIAAGNCAIVKPSELSPNCSLVVSKVLRKCLDQRFYRVCEGKDKVATKLIKQRFDLIFFTGSTQKGKLVATEAGKNLVPCILELGGKSPFIVDEDADPAWAAKKLLAGKLVNCGQVCIAPDYLMIHESKVPEFMDAMRKQLQEGYDNNSMKEGKIINQFHYRRLCSMLKNHGGEVILGNPNAHLDFNLEFTVIKNPPKDSIVLQEEIFGPILPMIVFSNFDEVINYITIEQEKPLVVYYFGKHNGPNQQRVLNETSSGAVATHEVIMQAGSHYLPFGGVGQSGFGRCNGKAGFQSFSNMKSVLAKPVADYFPFNSAIPPLTEETKAGAVKMLKKPMPTQAELWKFMKRVLFALILAFFTFVIIWITDWNHVFDKWDTFQQCMWTEQEELQTTSKKFLGLF